MQYNQRKLKAMELFARVGRLRPEEYAVQAWTWDRRGAYRDLKKWHRYGYLNRGRDIYGRVIYRLSGRGARWLWKNQGRY